MPDDFPKQARPAITPETKVGDLLREYPELEETLLRMSPAFGALRNPVLRRTVARVATLRQVAVAGDLALGKLITSLREAAGESGGQGDPPETPIGQEPRENEERPSWAPPERVVKSYDARPALEEGGHPLEEILRELRELPPGAVLELLTPFVPAPMRDLAAKNGFMSASLPAGPGLVRTFFRRAPDRMAADQS